ncbi:MAG: hypothetical protein ACLPXB_14070 [Thiobacillaceae bacterium]
MPNFMLAFFVNGQKLDADQIALGVCDNTLDLEQKRTIKVQHQKRT